MIKLLFHILFASLMIGMTSPAQAASIRGIYLGDTICVGEGTARSFVKMDRRGQPTSIGVILTQSALSGLPESTQEHSEDTEYRLSLPWQARRTGFTHVGLNWNPSGHYPVEIYGTPHFDFHFYRISQSEREGITAAVPTKQPDPSIVPPDYTTEPGPEVPGMGAHWADVTSPEFHGQPFTQTLIYGYHNNKLAFIEPMITKAFLETKPNVSTAIKQPAVFADPGFYPTHYRVNYREDREEYIISLDGLRESE